MTDLQDAIAELRRVSPEDGWTAAKITAEHPDPMVLAGYVATTLNAVLSGDLIPRADADLAVAEAIRRAAEAVIAGNTVGMLQRKILALAPADALDEVQRLREERDELRAAVEGLIAVLDRNDKKGPIPDVEMFFCWLAAQDVRAAFRKIAPKGEAT